MCVRPRPLISLHISKLVPPAYLAFLPPFLCPWPRPVSTDKNYSKASLHISCLLSLPLDVHFALYYGLL